MTATSARERVVSLIADLRAERISVAELCDAFEGFYNFEKQDIASLNSDEKEALQHLFDVVTWYSPFSEERAQIPGYQGEQEVMAIVDVVARTLDNSTARG